MLFGYFHNQKSLKQTQTDAAVKSRTGHQTKERLEGSIRPCNPMLLGIFSIYDVKITVWQRLAHTDGIYELFDDGQNTINRRSISLVLPT